ncbi:MAG: radical SAM protein, partial [Proteobacteria bacterium]|nr:radical SAM protein [Pseudomonadota bacterium]
NLVDALKYTFNKKPYTMILTSRGCPNDCVFCSVHSIAGHGYRKRNIDNVLCEMDECIKRYGIEVFDFQDDNLLFDVDRIKGLLEKMILRYGKRRFELLATNGLNSANIDEELLILMKEAGFNKLDISLATGAVSSRDSFNRPETIGQYESVLEKAVSLGLGVTTYIILGFPEQPLDELKQTINYLKDKKTLISPSVFYNVSGMPIYEKMRKYEYLDSDIARRSTAFNSRGRDFEREDIFNMFSNIRNSNYSIRQG